MNEYYKDIPNKSVDSILPATYHLITETDMSKNERFVEILEKHKDGPQDKIWIVKPGENSNRGLGIEVFKCFKKICRCNC